MAKVKAHRRVPWDKRVSRGNPTQEGEQVGDKTFGVICQRERVFPKSLAQPRSGGETPSRAAPSCPVWRSHAKRGEQPLSRRGRGDGYRGRLRSANRPHPLIPSPISQGARGAFTPVQCASLIGTLLVSRKGEGMVTADDYASLIDPT